MESCAGGNGVGGFWQAADVVLGDRPIDANGPNAQLNVLSVICDNSKRVNPSLLAHLPFAPWCNTRSAPCNQRARQKVWPSAGKLSASILCARVWGRTTLPITKPEASTKTATNNNAKANLGILTVSPPFFHQLAVVLGICSQ